MTNSKAHVIVVSNEKGGTGKSTISMHLAIKLMQEGFRVAVVDTDGRQGTLTHYIENRRRFCRENDLNCRSRTADDRPGRNAGTVHRPPGTGGTRNRSAAAGF